jgi:hypothetical protein
MKTKSQIIKDLKLAYPVIRDGNDTDGYVELSDVEYEARIAIWADNELEQLNKQAEAAAKESARQALLSRLGITQEEAQLLLGGK